MSLSIPGIGQNNLENRSKENDLLSYMRYEMHTVQEALAYMNERANISTPKPEVAKLTPIYDNTKDSHEYALTSEEPKSLNPLVPQNANNPALPSLEDIQATIAREAK